MAHRLWIKAEVTSRSALEEASHEHDVALANEQVATLVLERARKRHESAVAASVATKSRMSEARLEWRRAKEGMTMAEACWRQVVRVGTVLSANDSNQGRAVVRTVFGAAGRLSCLPPATAVSSSNVSTSNPVPLDPGSVALPLRPLVNSSPAPERDLLANDANEGGAFVPAGAAATVGPTCGRVGGDYVKEHSEVAGAPVSQPHVRTGADGGSGGREGGGKNAIAKDGGAGDGGGGCGDACGGGDADSSSGGGGEIAGCGYADGGGGSADAQEAGNAAWSVVRRTEDGDHVPELPSQDELISRHGLSAVGKRRGLPAPARDTDDGLDMCSNHSACSERSAARTVDHCSSSNDTNFSLADVEYFMDNKADIEACEYGSVPDSP